MCDLLAHHNGPLYLDLEHSRETFAIISNDGWIFRVSAKSRKMLNKNNNNNNAMRNIKLLKVSKIELAN